MARVHGARNNSSVSNELAAKLEGIPRSKLFLFTTIGASLLVVMFLVTTVVFLVLFLKAPSLEALEDRRFHSNSTNGKFKKAAVVSENTLCSEAGRNVLLAGGNAPEAAIATLLCIGVVHPHLSGLGGGFFMTIYNSTTKKCSAVNARETAPLKATDTMFVNNKSESEYGYRSVAVPSELHGHWTVFKRFGSGKVAWPRLFEDSIRLARDGYPFPDHVKLFNIKQETLNAPLLKDLLYHPGTKTLFTEGDIIKREKLSKTLEKLANAEDPVELFYRGEMAKEIAKEFKENNGLIDLESLGAYSTLVHDEAYSSELTDELTLCGPPLPSSFVITQSIIRTMQAFYGDKKSDDLSDPKIYHRYIESAKFAYAARMKMGDADFVEGMDNLTHKMMEKDYPRHILERIKDHPLPLDHYANELLNIPEDHGTSSVSIIDQYGNSVVVTSTTNTKFGSRMVSPTLGIPWNNEMDDFSTPGLKNHFGFPPSKSNYIVPGKRPMSSMSPTIVYSKTDGKVKLAVGASGGTYIISSVSQTTIRSLIFGQSIKEAIDAPRIHNPFSAETLYEDAIPKKVVDQLRAYGHSMSHRHFLPTAVSALKVEDDGYIHANTDYRKTDSTYPSGF